VCIRFQPEADVHVFRLGLSNLAISDVHASAKIMGTNVQAQFDLSKFIDASIESARIAN
jgi:hypothetical protein